MNCPNCDTPLPANARFCGSCGAVIAAASSTPTPVHPATKRPSSTTPNRFLFLAGGVGVVVLCLLGLIVVLASGVLRGRDPLLIAVQDEPYGDVSEILLFDNNDPVTIGSAHDGYNSGAFSPSAIAPGGDWMVLLEIDGNTNQGYQLNLISLPEGETLFTNDEAICNFFDQSSYCGFSANGKYFAYTLYEERNEEASLSIINQKGEEITSLPDAVFLQFFPDNQRFLFLEYLDGEIEGLAWADVDKGETNSITNLSSDDFITSWPILSPDGKQVYLVMDNDLMGVPAEGGSLQRLYQEVNNINLINDLLAVYTEEGAILLDPKDNSIIPLERNAEVENIAEAQNGGLVGYLIEDGSGVTLYVVDEDGENKTAITEADNWIVFAFSPNGQQIAFVETEDYSSGDLYIANIDGSERLRLATDVQSFHFAKDGRHIIYSEVSGLNNGRPESTIYSIRTNGKDEEVLLDTRNGVLTLLTLSD